MVNKPLIGVAAAVVVVAAGAIFYFRFRHPAESMVPPPAPPAAASAASESEEGAIQHPLPAASEAAQAPLPQLNDSDSSLRDALSQLAGAQAVGSYLKPDNVVRNMVVTIDNLTRAKLAVDKRPTTPVSGQFLASGDEVNATLDPKNYERYQPWVAVVQKLDAKKLAELYIHFYPLFQQAYQNLGYPNGYFNDRLVQVIDSLLATPTPSGPIQLARPNVMYTFSDPSLESRPVGQKLLLRMGPDNAAIVKEKLTELRAVITASPPKR
ncbi:MAG TPA: DUF3014 domain-containing protein [Steroidobacteraceae bacterium]|jgi:hypothetical protein